jgi:4-hydroxy-tetrahydrodipicolinate synthase
MPRHASFVPHGVIPAVLLPFHDDLSIDEKSICAMSARRRASRRSP